MPFLAGRHLEPHEESWRDARADLTFLIDAQAQLGGRSIYMLTGGHGSLALAEMAGIGVCIDLFGCWTEAGLRASIERAIPRCNLIQLSDYVYGDRSLPSRAVPGDGAIPLARILDWMLAAGYTGAFDLELIGPRIDQEGHLAAVRRTGDYLGKILASLGA